MKNNAIRLQNKNWKLEIDLQGGRIIDLTYGDECILGTYNRIDGKQGNTHICLPNFGSEGVKEFDLPFHGPVRNSKWNKELGIKNKEDQKMTIRCTVEKTEKYQADLRVRQTFELQDNCFIHEIEVVHKGGKPVPINIGIHNYWNSPNGWDGVRLNGEDITQKVKTNGDIVLEKKNTIVLPNMSPITWELDGFSNAVIWSGFIGKKYDSQYVCIEPVMGTDNFFGSNKSLLQMNKQISVRQIISLM